MSVVGAVYGVAVLAVVVWYSGIVWKATDSYFKEEFTKHLQETGVRPRPVFTKETDEPRPVSDQPGLHHVLERLPRHVQGRKHSDEGLAHPGRGSESVDTVQGRVSQSGHTAEELVQSGQALTESLAGQYPAQQGPTRETREYSAPGVGQSNDGTQPDTERNPTHQMTLSHLETDHQEQTHSAESQGLSSLTPHYQADSDQAAQSEPGTARQFQAESDLFSHFQNEPEPTQYQAGSVPAQQYRADSDAAQQFKTETGHQHRAELTQAQYDPESGPTLYQDKPDQDHRRAWHVTAPQQDRAQPHPVPMQYQADGGVPQQLLTQSESCLLHSSDACSPS